MVLLTPPTKHTKLKYCEQLEIVTQSSSGTHRFGCVIYRRIVNKALEYMYVEMALNECGSDIPLEVHYINTFCRYLI